MVPDGPQRPHQRRPRRRGTGGDPNEEELNPEPRDFLDEEEEGEEEERPAPAPAAPPRPRRVERAAAVTPDGFVEVIARIPHRRTKVVITIEVEPPEEPPAPPQPDRAQPFRTGEGRRPSPRQPVGPREALRIGGGRD
ncbi:MAG TPA: hypothetical protein VLE27_05865, partial [Thermoanaerobaculia bacterium]|nr:hypothetical protein [Thermoanaerobaculia bacterium]